ncbi:MAG: quinol:cytochrome C oxidoreductase [Thermonemataceae bacterium]|nr:quinol:cytochrome C oxidoreductase [Thermonemataceae bacterium]
MADVHHIHYDLDQKYVFTAGQKKNLLIAMVVGLILFVVGAVLVYTGVGSHHETHKGKEDTHKVEGKQQHQEAGKEAHQAEHHYNPLTRVWANLWLNSTFFMYISVMGVFFVAVQYVAYAGWSAGIRRVAESFGAFIPIAGAILLVVFFVGGHDLFHWTHHDLYEKGKPTFDKILNAKSAYFFFPLEAGSFPFFWVFRTLLYIGVWYGMYRVIRNMSIKEDFLTEKGDYTYHKKNITFGAIFIVIFGYTESTSAWDWIMSIDPHWYSTMYGWYVFASSWVSALAVLTLAVVYLKEQGYLKMVNENHLHDLGKFMFGFSIFWAYIWFSQFLLQSYSNIPEETIYWDERMDGLEGVYSPLIIFNVIVNFAFPFLFLMTRDAKRKTIFLKVTAFGILAGHYLDFFVMIMPGTTKGNGGFFILEIGTLLLFASAFVYVFATTLSKALVVAKNHPMLEESYHHNI